MLVRGQSLRVGVQRIAWMDPETTGPDQQVLPCLFICTPRNIPSCSSGGVCGCVTT